MIFFNEIILLLFTMEIDPSTKSVVQHAYIIDCVFLDENYTFAEFIATSKGEKVRKPRVVGGHGSTCADKKIDRNVLGITNMHILEHALEGGTEAPSNRTSHEVKRFTILYGMPPPLCLELSGEF
jgi:hypothetical protein